jgi:hypothetical protein
MHFVHYAANHRPTQVLTCLFVTFAWHTSAYHDSSPYHSPLCPPPVYEGVCRSFQTELIMKYMLTTINTCWEATQSVMVVKLTRLTHKIVIQVHLVSESCTICSSRSSQPVWKLFGCTPVYYSYFHTAGISLSVYMGRIMWVQRKIHGCWLYVSCISFDVKGSLCVFSKLWHEGNIFCSDLEPLCLNESKLFPFSVTKNLYIVLLYMRKFVCICMWY